MRHVVAVGEGLSRLGILSGGPPLSLFDMLFATEGVQELDVPLVVCPLWWFICLVGHGSFSFCSLFCPFGGALVNLWSAGFHHIVTLI